MTRNPSVLETSCMNDKIAAAAAAAKWLQSWPILCDPIDGSPPGSPVPGILQARTLEWVAISFSSAWKWKVIVKLLTRVRLFATHGLQPTRLLRPWDFPGKSTGVLVSLKKSRVLIKFLFSWNYCTSHSYFGQQNITFQILEHILNWFSILVIHWNDVYFCFSNFK